MATIRSPAPTSPCLLSKHGPEPPSLAQMCNWHTKNEKRRCIEMEIVRLMLLYQGKCDLIQQVDN